VFFMPDGKQVLSKVEHNSVRWFDASTGTAVGEIQQRDASLSAVSLSPDGTRLASVGLKVDRIQGHSGVIMLWDVGLRQESKVLFVDKDERPEHVAFLDNRYLAVALAHGKVQVWDIEQAKVQPLKLGKATFGALSTSPDGRYLATASGKEVWITEWRNPDSTRRIDNQDVETLAFSPDSRTLAGSCRGDEEAEVRLWDVATLRVTGALTGDASLRFAPGMEFSPDGAVLACTDEGRSAGNSSGGVVLWDLASRKVIRRIATPGESVNTLSFSPNGARIAAGTDSGVHLFQVRTGEPTLPEGGHRGRIASLAFLADGTLATASTDATLRHWDVETGRQRRSFKHGAWVAGMAISPDGKLAATSSLDGFVYVWDLATGRQVHRLLGHGRLGGARTVAFALSGAELHSFGDDLNLRTWDVKSGRLLTEHALRSSGFPVPDDDGENFLDEVRLTPDGQTLSVLWNQEITIFDVASGKEQRKMSTTSPWFGGLAVSADSTSVLSTFERPAPPGDGEPTTGAQFWDLKTGQPGPQITLPAGLKVMRMACSPDGRFVAVTSGMGVSEIRVFDAKTREELQLLKCPGRASAVAFSHDGRRLAAGISDTTVLVWELKKR